MSDAEAKNILKLYDTHADAFARLRSRQLMEKAWLDTFLHLVGAHGSVVDIGCGNGRPIAEYCIQQGFQVTGVDGASAMLARAQQAFPEQRWVNLDMRQMALEKTFDGLIAWDSFFHLTREDQRLMFPIFARHSQPGSALMFTSGTCNGIAMGEFEGEPLYHASLSPEEYRQLLAENGFTVLQSVFEDPHCGGHTVWLCQFA
ncbi:class I SAM-dependent methyltransferase [Lelliottia sp. CFBP8978]|jgi:2-polyprenyl-3-methyl-5-hydroxy-6-metoxy-1,4-benzoquinol methylase|uniref:class I SAM-dependent DNA methyltransferase n=1 Tax=Lelliottia sp. CFBP8978 TaxID=3096522 RepID=UPI002A6B33D1|nr:class I SAM-dependent methyltransferase [Lelliottia sp. CFBP8978]MDY1036871.1 class I SAM-dependent methyltransferase [Lelliottia sp. CFBP8978]